MFCEQESRMKAENPLSPKNSKSAQSSTMEKVWEKKLDKQLLPAKQTSLNYTPLPVWVSLQSTCQDSGPLDTMFKCLPSIPSTINQNPAEAEPGTSEHFSLHSASSSGCVHPPPNITSQSSLFKGQSRSSTPSTMVCDPDTCPIIPGCETTIDISKGRTGLGLSIVGGCDTLLVKPK